MNNRRLNFFKKWHRWPALAFSLFFLAWALSGIVLNHRQLFSRYDINRSYLPEEYRFKDWNNAAVKSGIPIGQDSLVLFGNIGAWLTDQELSRFEDFNRGFPAGTDNRKIFYMLRSERGNLYAGTLFGLYYFEKSTKSWKKLPLDIPNERIVSLLEKDDEILILTRSEVLKIRDNPENLSPAHFHLPPPQGYDHKEGVFRTFWVIHSGEIWGMAGQLIVDLAGIILIILTITGLIHFIAPYILRKRKKKKLKLEIVSWWKRNSIIWHKRAGIWIALLLFINIVTGMFLRPPLLIPIANAEMKKIPWSALDTENAWEDKLRDIAWDRKLNGFLISTSKGFFLADEEFKHELVPMYGQPPVSVMGINAFMPQGDGTYLVGSFSGLYRWDPLSGHSVDNFSGDAPEEQNTGSRPIGEKMVAGYLRLEDGREWYLDYNLGAVPVHHKDSFPPMTNDILKSSPMSWWNFALEFHTGRIYKIFMRDFYILLIPLMGFSGVILVLSGTSVWLNLFRRKRKCGKTN